jgi:bacterioferritin-associated ferredoxin
MYVCHCMAVTDRAVRAAIASGACTIADITASCRGAGRGCGGCQDRLQGYLDILLRPDGSAESAAAARIASPPDPEEVLI